MGWDLKEVRHQRGGSQRVEPKGVGYGTPKEWGLKGWDTKGVGPQRGGDSKGGIPKGWNLKGMRPQRSGT